MLMRDPVVLAADGHTYERASLEQWFAACNAEGRPRRSPLTGALRPLPGPLQGPARP